jgi:hypothetical protein
MHISTVTIVSTNYDSICHYVSALSQSYKDTTTSQLNYNAKNFLLHLFSFGNRGARLETLCREFVSAPDRPDRRPHLQYKV